MDENEEKNLVFDVTVVVFIVIIIIALAGLFYYYALKNKSISQSEMAFDLDNQTLAGISSKKQTDTSKFTKVISFNPPEVLPETIKKGNCSASSIAEPYRDDAWRCVVDKSIYDPCFTTKETGKVFCQMNPLKENAFLIETENPLPPVTVENENKNNWAWFVRLRDGTFCSPYIGTRPFVGEDIAYYGCSSNEKSKTVVLMGDLISGKIWKANKAVIVQNGDNKMIESSEVVEIDSVWQ